MQSIQKGRFLTVLEGLSRGFSSLEIGNKVKKPHKVPKWLL